MEYKELVSDFAKRTQVNLDLIENLKAEGKYEVFEVTQLINSMLGLLVFPQQSFIDNIPEVPLNELVLAGWPVPETTGDFPQPSDLKKLVRYMRNAIAHFNISFISNECSNISGIKIWNTDPRRDWIKTWEAKLSIGDLRNITMRFVKLIIDSKPI